MGRTIPSFRIAAEMEISKWRAFRHALDKRDRKVFDEMLSIARLYNVAGTMACRPVLTHTILMSIIFEHYKKLTILVSEKNPYANTTFEVASPSCDDELVSLANDCITNSSLYEYCKDERFIGYLTQLKP